MVNRVDGVILGVGVVVLAASIIGVVLYEEEGAVEFAVSWEEGEATALAELTDGGGPGTYELTTTLNESMLARAIFTVDVTANGRQVNDDTVTVTVEGPNGSSADCDFTITATPTAESGAGSCEADALFQEPPAGLSVQASNQTDAEQAALDQTAMPGEGEWTITVQISGGQEVADPSYAISVTPSVVHYEPSATLPGEGFGRGAG